MCYSAVLVNLVQHSVILTQLTAVEYAMGSVSISKLVCRVCIPSDLEESENDLCLAFGNSDISPRFSKIRLRRSPRFSNIRLKRVYRVLVRCITKTRQPSDWSPRYRVSPRFSQTPSKNSQIQGKNSHFWPNFCHIFGQIFGVSY